MLLLRKHLPTVEVWAYGSRVKGQSHDGSDLNLVLRSPDLQPIPADSLASFSEALRASTIPFLVAAHDWARLPESFHPEIEREHLVLVAADSRPPDQQDSAMKAEWRELRWGDLATLEYGRALRGHNSRTGPIRVFGTNGRSAGMMKRSARTRVSSLDVKAPTGVFTTRQNLSS